MKVAFSNRESVALIDCFVIRSCTFLNLPHTLYELPWPSGYELRLSLERSRVLILVKVDDRKGIRSKNGHCSRKVPINNWAPS